MTIYSPGRRIEVSSHSHKGTTMADIALIAFYVAAFAAAVVLAWRTSRK